MTPERWRRISRIYHDALAQPAEERDQFLREAGAGDPEIEKEVRSLLAQSSGGDFLGGRAASPEERTLTGQLGRFELRGLLGSGGMGEVYRAHDAALGRDVAVKVLPRAFTTNPDRLARFEREARLLAALNHPHVAAIYGVEEIPPEAGKGQSGLRALVLELVEGETLAERLRHGRLPMGEALRLARQVAGALDAAHEKGIVHRDLKPANIKIRPDGTAKVLDFGLAKAVGLVAAGSKGGVVPPGETSEGVILGTPAYMSPEQARGQTVDKRTDVWAFGCVLHEMLAGRPAFGGKTATDTIAAVVNAEPDLSALPSATPPGVRRVIARCLVKDLRRRMRDIGDAEADLEDALREPAVAAVGRRWGALPWFVTAVALAALSWLGLERFSDSRSSVEWSLERVTYDSGLTTMPALSPDGQLVAYASDRGGRGDLDIWVQQVGGGVPLRLTSDPADDQMPEFSPDGKQIVFRSERAGGGVYLVSALGGPERLIVPEGRRPRFSPDGSRLLYWTGQFRGVVSNLPSELFVVDLGGGTPMRLAPEFAAARDGVWAPDGRSLLFLGRSNRESPVSETFDWWWAPLDGRAPAKTDVFASGLLVETIAFQGEGSPSSWTRDGVLFTARRGVWTVPISMEDGRPRGRPRHLASVTGRAEAPSAAPDGSVVFAVTHSQRVVERVTLGPGAEEHLPTRLYVDNRSVALRAGVTADGSTLVVDQGYEDYREIWLRDTRTGRQQMLLRVTTGFPVSPTISADGARVAYTVATLPGTEDDAAGYVAETAGGVPKVVCELCRLYGFLSDHHRLLASWEGERVLGFIDVRDGSKAALIRVSEGRVDRPHASPDDRWLAFRHAVGASGSIYVTRLAPNRPATLAEWRRIEQPTTTGRPCGWSLDSTVVYTFLDTDGFRCVWGQRIEGETGRLDGTVFPVRHLHVQMHNGPSTSFSNPVTSEGMLYERVVRTGDLWRLVRTPRSSD
jgi:eukaryotic-like serine/threonine-protein kinase